LPSKKGWLGHFCGIEQEKWNPRGKDNGSILIVMGIIVLVDA